MGKKSLFKKATAFAIITIFFTTSILPTISGNTIENNEKQNMKSQKLVKEQDDVEVTFYSFGLHEQSTKEIKMSYNEVEKLLSKISGYSTEIAYDSRSGEAQELQQEIFALTDELGLLPESISTKTIQTEYSPLINIQNTRNRPIPILQNRASAFFCNFATTGTGSQFPIIIFPRLIPIIQLPIPRVFLRWTATEGITSCGGLLSGKGFIAYGQQKGLALGFWGIGFSVFLPPIMQYGFIGYALYVSADAENIELWPPNYTPEASAIYPPHEAENIPISTSELQFHISDANGDLMDYTVTTNPDIGSGEGTSKPDGTYSIPISGLEGTEEYQWTVQVTDGVNILVSTFTFTTEPDAPIVYDPIPENGAQYISVDQSQLQFTLKDLQGDSMDYTVETVPDIGSGSDSGVGDGTYSIPISDLEHSTEYTWFVNVTDGEHWKHKEFHFQTEPVMEFDPFDEGWQYRKEITIDHTLVEGDLNNFPIVLHTIDTDLADHTQSDGDDILFMDGTGIARRLYHEIEYYDDSSGELIVWINVTEVSSSENTEIWLYYGNPGCSSQQHPIVVWDSDYLFVSHMDGSGTTISDSTSNGNDGTKDGANDPEEVNGKIGKCQDFEKDNSEHIVLNNMIAGLSAMTVEAWEKAETKTSSVHVMSTMYGSDGGTGDIAWRHQTNSDTSGFGFDAWKANSGGIIGSVWSGSGADIVLGTWQYYTGVWTGSSLYVYVDSTLEGTTNSASGTMASHASMKTAIGATDIGYGNYHDGLLDEIRISGIARSPEWISTEYNNQNDPSNFLSIGPEEPAP